jgi:hypothetical protein
MHKPTRKLTIAEVDMLFYQLKLQSSYLLSASIKKDFNLAGAAVGEAKNLLKQLRLDKEEN